MAYTRIPQQRSSLLGRWAPTAHRASWRIVAARILVLGALVGGNFLFSGTFVSEFRVPGAESRTARDL